MAAARVEKTEIDGAGDDGIDLERSDHTLVENTIENTGGERLRRP